MIGLSLHTSPLGLEVENHADNRKVAASNLGAFIHFALIFALAQI